LIFAFICVSFLHLDSSLTFHISLSISPIATHCRRIFSNSQLISLSLNCVKEAKVHKCTFDSCTCSKTFLPTFLFTILCGDEYIDRYSCATYNTLYVHSIFLSPIPPGHIALLLLPRVHSRPSLPLHPIKCNPFRFENFSLSKSINSWLNFDHFKPYYIQDNRKIPRFRFRWLVRTIFAGIP
jgi:hypothetical protein